MSLFINSFRYKNRVSLFALATILIVIGIVQSQNMLQFPYFQDTEGTNLANAWSIANNGDLSPYTYAYDEPPLGSFVLSAWASLLGGFDTFGFSLNSGRVLMLLFHIATAGLIYGITRKVTRSTLAAIIATLVFALSPLATSLQRRILLDNIMIVWLLFSLYLIMGQDRKLVHYFLSAGFFGLAVLTKGVALFFLPAFIIIIKMTANDYHKRFASGLWATLAVLLVCFYPLYAQMRQELFPEGWFLGGDFPHVSLIERIVDRGPSNGSFLNIGAGLPESFRLWVDLSNPVADPIIIIAGFVSIIFVMLIAMDNRHVRVVLVMTITYIVAMLLGGYVFDADVLTLLPFMAMNIGIVLAGIIHWFYNRVGNPVWRYGLIAAILVVMLYPFWIFYSNRLDIYTANQIDGQISAINWIEDNVPEGAVVVTDNYAFVELREIHENTHYYWKIDTDPDIKFNLLNDDLCNLDFLVLTPQVQSDINLYNLDLMRRSVEQSEVLVQYNNNGWPVEIRQVSKEGCAPQIVEEFNDMMSLRNRSESLGRS